MNAESSTLCLFALQESANLLTAAQRVEDDLLKSSQPDLRQRRDVPIHPEILCRTHHSVHLTHSPLKINGDKMASFYTVYAKSYGSGVGLSINSAATEHPGNRHRMWELQCQTCKSISRSAANIELQLTVAC